MRVAGERMRVTVSLVDAATGQQIWAQRYDRLLSDVFAVQDEITDQVLSLIEPNLYTAEGRRAASIPPESLDAWGLVVTAIGLIHRFERQPNDRARDLLERAISLEPQYARAHAVLSWAECWAREFYWIRDREKALQSSLDHAEIALRLDRSEPWSPMVAGFVRSNLGHHGRALDELNTAVELNPNLVIARMLRGWAMVRAGAFEEAVRETDHALRLRPADQFGCVYLATHGLALLAARRFEEALPNLRAAVMPHTEYMGHCNQLISCCGHLGLQEEARRWLDFRERMLGRPFLLANAATALRGYAHAEIFLEGLAKAGVR
jgi:adenylate cyclase